MIVTGDVAIAHGDTFVFSDMEHLSGRHWVINLEGFITQDLVYSDTWCVYNSATWEDSFNDFNIRAAFIGNNHIQDIDNGIAQSISYLTERNILFFGAGLNAKQRTSYTSVVEGDLNYKLLGFGWPVIGCKAGKNDDPGVNKFDYDNVIGQAESLLNSCENTRVVVVIHGNYEFEYAPQPGHRLVAKELIDLGVYSWNF